MEKYELEFLQSKNNLPNFKINSILYHSLYDPKKEGERFCDSVNFPYTPSLIFVIEPGFDYISNNLEKKYPNAKIYNIRIISKFFDEKNSISYEMFENFCFSHFSSHQLLNSFIIYPPVTQKVFPQTVNEIWQTYKNHLEKRKTELISRQYFEKKWLLNTINFFKYINNYLLPRTINMPVLIVASGASLEESINVIKENQNKFFIIALSSAINVLLYHNIKPDLCISTDGGFWAKKHLKSLEKNNIPLALSSESAIPKSILENNLILPLGYSDGLSSSIFKAINFPFSKALRNPTVSGTALHFARVFTTSDIFCFGLDLCTKKGFSHARPNVLEIENSINDNKIATLSKRALASEYATSSLDIFKNSISMINNLHDCYRIITPNINNNISNIRDIDLETFLKYAKKYENKDKKDIFIKSKYFVSKKDKQVIKEKLIKHIEKLYKENELSKELFPLDELSILHATNNENAKESNAQLEKKLNDFMKKVYALFETEEQ